MKVSYPSHDVLTVKTETVIAVVCGLFGLLLAGIALYSYFTHAGTIQGNIFFGQAGAAATLLLFSAVFYEQSSFTFNRARRQLVWKRQTVFSRAGGSLGFDAIKSIVIQRRSDNDNNTTARVAVVTETDMLPLSRSYIGNNGHIVGIAELLNKWVLDRSPDLVLESVKASLAHGSRVDAAVMLRKAYSLSLTEAKAILDDPVRLDALPPLPSSDDTPDISSGDKETLLGLAALITLVVGPLCLLLGVNGYIKGVGSENWPQTSAVVTASGYTSEIENDEHEFALEYSYTVGGVHYTSNALYIKPIMNDKKSYAAIPKWYLADDEVAHPRDYPRGRTTVVYYDPDDPQSAVIRPGVSGSVRAVLAAGVVFTIMYLFLARRDLRRRAMRGGTNNRYST